MRPRRAIEGRVIGVVLLFLLWIGAEEVRAQGELMHWMDPQLGKLRSQGSFQVSQFFKREVQKQDTDISWTQQELKFFTPLVQDEDSEWGLLGQIGVIDIDSCAILADTGSKLPDHLWDIQLGGQYRRRLNQDWIGGLRISLGSASNKPFDSVEELIVNALGTLQIPHQDRNAWLFMLHYSNNRDFLPHVPIPGVAYLWQSQRTLRAVLGVPFAMVHWEPAEQWSVDASYFVPRTIRTKLQYEIVQNLNLYAGFAWQNQRYFRAEREDEDDRLFYCDKRVLAGTVWQITERITLDVQAGFAFDSFFFEGEDYGDRGENRIEMQDGFYTGLQARIHF